MLHEDRGRALSFGTDADLYHRTRPSYPAELVDALAGAGPCRVLDVGCGTGIVAELFAARGCQVLGLEPDERMAAYARRSGFQVDTASFEDWDPSGRSFDLVVSGQAWHWVDPHRGALKAADALRPGGHIGLFWNRATHPPDIQATFGAIYHRLAPGLESHSIVLGQGTGDRFDVAADGIEASQRYGPVERSWFPWRATYTTRKWLDHLVTHSDHQSLPAGQKDQLLSAIGEAIDGLGGSFSTRYDTVLIAAARL